MSLSQSHLTISHLSVFIFHLSLFHSFTLSLLLVVIDAIFVLQILLCKMVKLWPGEWDWQPDPLEQKISFAKQLRPILYKNHTSQAIKDTALVLHLLITVATWSPILMESFSAFLWLVNCSMPALLPGCCSVALLATACLGSLVPMSLSLASILEAQWSIGDSPSPPDPLARQSSKLGATGVPVQPGLPAANQSHGCGVIVFAICMDHRRHVLWCFHW